MFGLQNKMLAGFATAVAVMTLAAPAFAQDTVMFNYQGRVKVNGDPFAGNGQFKFAILSTNGQATLWSNDSTSIDSSEPTSGITLPVSDGVFNVLMGANGVMDSINSTVFQSQTPLKLRCWFNDGVHGFQALHPDHNLVNVNLITSQTGGDDFTIYVNDATGDDSNSGLRPDQAKKTIQAAVDIVPARVMANVTIDIADGVYPEEVLIYGISVKPGKSLSLIGDADWNVQSSESPKVNVTAADGLTTGIRKTALQVVECTGVSLNGLMFSGASNIGLSLQNGTYEVKNCFVTENGSNGINAGNQTFVTLTDCRSTSNGVHGIGVNTNSRAIITDCASEFNANCGLAVMDNSTAVQDGSGTYTENLHGVYCIGNSSIGASSNYHGEITNNRGYGIVAAWASFFTNYSATNNISGNAQGPKLTFAGGETNW